MTAPQTASYRIGQAFATGDIATIAGAIRDGFVDVATKVVGFIPRVVSDVVDSLHGSSPVQSETPESTSTEKVSATASALVARDAKSVAAYAPDIEPEKGSAAEPAKTSEPQTAVTGSQKSNGATDLTDGNKVEPGKTASTSGAGDQSDDTKTTDVTGEADNDLSSGDSDTTAAADAADDGTQQAAA